MLFPEIPQKPRKVIYFSPFIGNSHCSTNHDNFSIIGLSINVKSGIRRAYWKGRELSLVIPAALYRYPSFYPDFLDLTDGRGNSYLAIPASNGSPNSAYFNVVPAVAHPRANRPIISELENRFTARLFSLTKNIDTDNRNLTFNPPKTAIS